MSLIERVKSIDPIVISIYVMIFILFVGLGMFTYLRWFEGNPPVVVDSPVQVDKDAYILGVDTEVLITAHICRYTEVPALIFRAFVDEKGVVIGTAPNPIQTGSLEPGCQTVTVPVGIPNGLSLGPHIVDFTGVYQVNALATHAESWYTEQFLICDQSGNCGNEDACAGHGC